MGPLFFQVEAVGQTEEEQQVAEDAIGKKVDLKTIRSDDCGAAHAAHLA